MEKLLDINWDNFNSCVSVEITGAKGQLWYSGVAVNRETILTSAKILDHGIYKIYIHTNNSKKHEVESFDLHRGADIIKIRLKSALPNSTVIYPILKDSTHLSGKLVQLKKTAIINLNLQSKSIDNNYLILDQKKLSKEEFGSAIFLISGGQINLIGLRAKNKNPVVTSLRAWIG